MGKGRPAAAIGHALAKRPEVGPFAGGSAFCWIASSYFFFLYFLRLGGRRHGPMSRIILTQQSYHVF
jgi:hypothetical protein